MTVSTDISTARYEGNGVTDTFAFNGRVFATGNFEVDIITRATDALVETLLPTDFTVTIVSDEIASITVDAGKIPSSLQDILIRRNIDATQSLRLPTGTVFPASDVERGFDKLTVLIQQVSSNLNRSITLPATSSLSGVELPLPVANNLIAWNSTADNLTTFSLSSVTDNFDTIITGLTSGDLLIYNGTNWVNTPTIGQAQIADNSVGTGEIINGAVTTTKIADANVTRAKLATGAVAPVNVTGSKTANYTATTADDFIPCDATSGAFTVTLYAASGNAGRRITIKKTDSTFNVVTIDANASETIDGALTRRLCTQFEELVLVCDGSNWFIENRIIPSIWTTYTTTLSHSSGGITNNTNSFRYRRNGDSIEIMGTISFSAASAAFTGLFATIPSGLTIDTGKMTTATNFIQPIGQVNFLDSGVSTYRGDVLYTALSGALEIQYNIASTANVTGGTTTNAAPFTYGASDAIGITTHRIPITNWEG